MHAKSIEVKAMGRDTGKEFSHWIFNLRHLAYRSKT